MSLYWSKKLFSVKLTSTLSFGYLTPSISTKYFLTSKLSKIEILLALFATPDLAAV